MYRHYFLLARLAVPVTSLVSHVKFTTASGKLVLLDFLTFASVLLVKVLLKKTLTNTFLGQPFMLTTDSGWQCSILPNRLGQIDLADEQIFSVPFLMIYLLNKLLNIIFRLLPSCSFSTWLLIHVR